MPVAHPDNALGLNVAAVAKYYGAKYVGEFPFPVGEGFAERPASIFWRPPNLVRANMTEYFAITSVTNKPFGPEYGVSDGEYVTEYIFNGLKYKEDIKYSRCEKDKASFEDDVWIEGGFSFMEYNGKDKGATLVRLQVQDGQIVVIE